MTILHLAPGIDSLHAFVLRAFISCVLLVLPAGLALATDDVTQEQIIRALAPRKPLTRSLSAPLPDPAATASETRMIDSLRNRPTRSLSSGEREQIAAMAKDRPAIDLEITFDYNSADISQKAQPAIEALGKALSDPSLRGSTFLVAGHTDAAGPDDYNQALSERRADTIKRVLVDRFGLAGRDLVAVGYGETRLKDSANPAAGANRRVQVVNMQDQTAEK